MRNPGNNGLATPLVIGALALAFAVSLEGQSTFGTILGNVVDEKAVGSSFSARTAHRSAPGN